MRIGEVYRYIRLRDAKQELAATGRLPADVDGLPSFLQRTLAPDSTLTGLEAGINPIRKVQTSKGTRIPAVLIRSSPHKAGSATTPWQDHFAPDIGLAHYFGDAKPGQNKPADRVAGNRALLDQYSLHGSAEARLRRRAAPILLFQSVPAGGRIKGQVRFHGLSVISDVRRIVQSDPKTKTSFTNYRFVFTVLDLSSEGERFPWSWINLRRNPDVNDRECELSAPASWRRWVTGGHEVLPRLRRRVAKLLTIKRPEQMPSPGSRSENALTSVYSHYLNQKHRFEALAEIVTERIVNDSGADYRPGWITPPSSDGGADFVGRVDLGSGFARVKLVVLGQAKCVTPASSISAKELARVVARLRRGWIGAFVTTGFYSLAAQREAIEDRYPLLLVNGRDLSKAVLHLAFDAGTNDTLEYLKKIDKKYEGRVKSRLPEEILLEA